MTPDTATLRELLQDRADLAPDPLAVLPATHERVGRRRVRQQRAALAGVALVTAGVLTAVVVAASGQEADSASTPGTASQQSQAGWPFAPDGRTPLIWRPSATADRAIPFTVGWVPNGYSRHDWSLSELDATVTYSGRGMFVVGMGTSDPSTGITRSHHAPIRGADAMIGSLADGWLQLSWQVAPGAWVRVLGTPELTEQQLGNVARSVDGSPTPLVDRLRLSAGPTGFDVRRWADNDPASSRGDDIVMCPATMIGPPGPDVPAPCIEMRLSAGPLDRADLVRIGASDVWRSADGRTVSRELDLLHVVTATSRSAPTDALREAVLAAALAPA